MQNLWCDLETRCRVPIKYGSYAYAEKAGVLLFAYAVDDGMPAVWDVASGDDMPADLRAALSDESVLVWFHNGTAFDFPVLRYAMPRLHDSIAPRRRRDTLIQAFSHALPGSLDKLGAALNLADDKLKSRRGKALIRLFCIPLPEDDVSTDERVDHFDGATYFNAFTHPAEWAEFIEYAKADIVTMREAHRLMPKWNMSEKQMRLAEVDARINGRGFRVDATLARDAIGAVSAFKAELAKESKRITGNKVAATTQRDAVLGYVLAAHGVELPDMRADTIERRLQDDTLPDAVKELLRNRLQASMNSTAKYTALVNAMSTDGRMRGGAQFRGAGRTGRYAHRLFQFGNLPRPTLPQSDIDAGIECVKHGALDVAVGGDVMAWASSAVRGCIVASPGKKLVIADLANIEGRVAAWLAGEEWKLQAFRDFDTIVGTTAKGKPIRKGADLYIRSYASAFNVPIESVPEKGDERQIGKVQELMFQFGGGVGAWLTGAATYGIDLTQMAEQVYETIPPRVLADAASFLDWKYSQLKNPTDEVKRAEARMGLAEKVFIVCDSIKRLWRSAHPEISSYWKELEDAIRTAYNAPGTTIRCRRLKIRRSGSWLRVGLPSGRELTYPEIKVSDSGEISYVGPNTYTRKWERVKTYGGKGFENFTQSVACDQFVEGFEKAEQAGFEIVAHVHDELICEAPIYRTDLNSELLGACMCADLGWNEGLPLAAAGFTTLRYRKD